MRRRFRRYSKEDPEHDTVIQLFNSWGEGFYVIARLFRKIYTELCEAVWCLWYGWEYHEVQGEFERPFTERNFVNITSVRGSAVRRVALPDQWIVSWGPLWQNAAVAYFDVRYRLETCLWGHGIPMECVHLLVPELFFLNFGTHCI